MLSWVQHAAARLILELRIGPTRVQAFFNCTGWRSVGGSMQFKLCCLLHIIFYGNCPGYMSNREACCLWSSTSRSPILVDVGFLTAAVTCLLARWPGLAAWKALPVDLRAVTDSEVVRKLLKTHF